MIRGKETMNTLMTLTMMVFLNAIKTAGDCPRSCECKWKSGKESVLCVNANMTAIPKQLDSGTQLLDLTGNRLRNIGADEFFNASLLNLQKIFLSRCGLRLIDRCSFRKIINLVELDLSRNELHSVPSHAFEFITELRELRLNGNPIVRILNHAFRMVPSLTKLDLSECRIGYVEIKAFQGLENSLEWLKLDKNKLANIKPFALVNLKNLHGLELTDNPWNCSCGLRTLREWMTKQKVPYGIPPTCKHPPRLSGKIWDKLDLDEFACVPRIEAIRPRKSGEEGSNVTMTCSINGFTESRVRWSRKNVVIGNLSATGATEGKRKLYVVQITKEGSNLTILGADARDNGVYVCRAENKAGKSEANITLTVSPKRRTKIWSSRTMAAAGAVSLLFVTVLGLLTFCAWNFRKRKLYFWHPVTGREMVDSYEMNRKKPNSCDKAMQFGNHCSPNSTTNACFIQGRFPSREGYKNEKADIANEVIKGSKEVCPSNDSDGVMWASLKMTDVEEGPRKPSDFRLSPDLHIPRLNGRNCHIPKENDFPEVLQASYSMASSSSFAPNSTTAAEPRYLRSEKMQDNVTLYGRSLPDGHPHRRKFPDLLELSKNEENLVNNNSFCTMPGKGSCRAKRSRRGSCGSESRSPLLPGSSGESCDSNCSFGGRPPPDSNGRLKNASLPASPLNFGQTPALDLLDGSPEVLALSPMTLQYKSWELENFLKEYRNLQDQLYKMKESCESLKDDNLKFREERYSSNVENTTISKMISPVFGGATAFRPVYGLDNKFLDVTDNVESLYGGTEYLEEDNNNPKSILNRKSTDPQPVFGELDLRNDSRWSSSNQFLKALTEPNSGDTFYQG